MYNSLAFILVVCFLHGVKNGRVQEGSDNEKYLLLSSKKVQRVQQQRKHVDILREIFKVKTLIPLALDFNHVRGNLGKRIPAQLPDRPLLINTK